MVFTILWSVLLFGFLNQAAAHFGILNAIFSCNLPLQLVAHRNAQGYLNAIAAELTHIQNHCKASFFLDCHMKCFGYILGPLPHLPRGQGNNLWWMEFKLISI